MRALPLRQAGSGSWVSATPIGPAVDRDRTGSLVSICQLHYCTARLGIVEIVEDVIGYVSARYNQASAQVLIQRRLIVPCAGSVREPGRAQDRPIDMAALHHGFHTNQVTVHFP